MRGLAHGLPLGCRPLLQCVCWHWHHTRRNVTRSYAAALASISPWQTKVGSWLHSEPRSTLVRLRILSCLLRLQKGRRRGAYAAYASATARDTELSQEQAKTEPASVLRGKELFLYNTMSGKKERLRPREGQGNMLSMYCCGVTVYDLSHIGDSFIPAHLIAVTDQTNA